MEATSVNTYGEKQASRKGLVGEYFTASGSKSEECLIYSMWVCTVLSKQVAVSMLLLAITILYLI